MDVRSVGVAPRKSVDHNHYLPVVSGREGTRRATEKTKVEKEEKKQREGGTGRREGEGSQWEDRKGKRVRGGGEFISQQVFSWRWQKLCLVIDVRAYMILLL